MSLAAEIWISITLRLEALVESGTLTYVRADVMRARAWEAGQEALRAMEPTS